MGIAQIVVTWAGIVFAGGLGWCFFSPGKVGDAVDGGQEVRVVLEGGYTPDVIHANVGVPLRIVFDRQEDGDCSSRVVFADLAQSSYLAPHAETTVDLLLDRAGTYGFACGMNMIHGSVVADEEQGRPAAVASVTAVKPVPAARVSGDGRELVVGRQQLQPVAPLQARATCGCGGRLAAQGRAPQPGRAFRGRWACGDEGRDQGGTYGTVRHRPDRRGWCGRTFRRHRACEDHMIKLLLLAFAVSPLALLAAVGSAVAQTAPTGRDFGCHVSAHAGAGLLGPGMSPGQYQGFSGWDGMMPC